MTDSPSPPVGDQEPGPIALLARLFLTQLLAVLAIAAVIAVAFSLLGLDDRSTVQTTRSEGDASTAAAGGPTATTPPPSGAAPGSTPSATTPPGSTAPGPATGTEGLPRVDVLNQSADGNAAESTASGLRSRGWRIGRVDNFNGNVRTTTIYYPPGRRSEARDLAAEFESAPRILPSFSTLSPSRLTVILVG